MFDILQHCLLASQECLVAGLVIVLLAYLLAKGLYYFNPP